MSAELQIFIFLLRFRAVWTLKGLKEVLSIQNSLDLGISSLLINDSQRSNPCWLTFQLYSRPAGVMMWSRSVMSGHRKLCSLCLIFCVCVSVYVRGRGDYDHHFCTCCALAFSGFPTRLALQFERDALSSIGTLVWKPHPSEMQLGLRFLKGEVVSRSLSLARHTFVA